MSLLRVFRLDPEGKLMELGTWADWTMCGVSVLSAAAVFYLGYQANRLGHDANKIAEVTRELAADAERREGRTLLLYVFADVAASMELTQIVHARLSSMTSRAEYATDAPYRAAVLKDLKGLQMPTVVENLPRLHTLGKEAGDALARAIGLLRLATDYARRSDSDTDRDFDHDQIRDSLGWMINDLAIVIDVAAKNSNTALRTA
ncbi:MAG TPA: hypothetical protein VGD21_10685 [Lysobacter sp.]